MPDSDLLNRLIERTDTHERRLSNFELRVNELSNDVKYVIKDLEDSRHTQIRTCETIVKTREELVSMLNIIKDNQHMMQKENVALSTSIATERLYRSENKADNKWVTNIILAIPQLLLTLAVIFTGLQIKHP